MTQIDALVSEALFGEARIAQSAGGPRATLPMVDPAPAAALWAVTLRSRHTGRPLALGGVPTTWYTRTPWSLVSEVMERRSPADWSVELVNLGPAASAHPVPTARAVAPAWGRA